MQPNLFRFATSELSQDAILCWLLSWTDNKLRTSHPHLHDVAKAILSSILFNANIEIPLYFSHIDIKKQFFGIDILCTINNEIVIIIEDKVGTKQHSNQLERYKNHAFDKFGFAQDKIIPVYIQTGDQSDYIEVKNNGYQTIVRSNLLEIFESETGKLAMLQSDIFQNFSEYVRQIEDDVQSYRVLPPSKWTGNSWKGFYTDIQQQLKEGNWDYVANPTGGFLGFWWHFNWTESCGVYLQLEERKFCFKISADNADERRFLRQSWHEKIILKCPAFGLKAKRPDRFGNGQYMTVAVLDQDYRVVNKNETINMIDTLKILKSAQSVIDSFFPTS